MITSNKKPSGFVALCRCGVYVGAIDANRTEQKEMSKTLGEWLFKYGLTVEPIFSGTWSVEIKRCKCEKEKAPE